MEEAVRMDVDVDTEVSDERKEKKDRTSMLINLSGSEEVPFPEALKVIAEVDTFGIFQNGQAPMLKPLLAPPVIHANGAAENSENETDLPATGLDDTFGIFKNFVASPYKVNVASSLASIGETENSDLEPTKGNTGHCMGTEPRPNIEVVNDVEEVEILANDQIPPPPPKILLPSLPPSTNRLAESFESVDCNSNTFTANESITDDASVAREMDDDTFGIFQNGQTLLLKPLLSPPVIHATGAAKNSESETATGLPATGLDDTFGIFKNCAASPYKVNAASSLASIRETENSELEPTKGNTGHFVGTEPMPNFEIVNDVEEVEILANDQVPPAEIPLPSPPPSTNLLTENLESVDCNSNTYTANELITKIDDVSVAAKDEEFASRPQSPHTPLLTSPCPAIGTGTAENSQCVDLTCSPFTGDESFMPIAAMNDSFGISKNGPAGVAPSDPLPATDPRVSPPPSQTQTTDASEPAWNWNPFTDDATYIPVVMRPPVATLESIRKMVEEIFTFTYSPYSSPKRPRMDVNVNRDTSRPSRHSSTRTHSVQQEKTEVPEVVSDRDMRMLTPTTPTRDICDFRTPPRTRTPSTVVRQANFTFKKDESQTSSYTSKKSTSSPCFKTPVKTKFQEPHDSSVKKASSCTRLSLTSTSSTSSVESDSKKRLLPVLPGRGALKFDKKPSSGFSNPFNTKLKFDTKPSAMTARVQPLKATLSSEFAVKARAEVKNEVKPSQPKVCASAPVHRKFLSPIAASSPKRNSSNQKLNSSFSGQNESYTLPTTPTRKRMSAVKSSGYGRPQASQQPSSATSSTISLNSTRTMESPSKRVSAPNLSRPILKSPMLDRKSESQLRSAPNFNVEENVKPAPLAAVASGGLRNKENIPRLINRFGFKK